MNLPQNAGLGAMMQAKGAGNVGVPKQSMNEMMALAQKLPDSELADVLAGKSMRVPQFAAMLAAMGRENLRTAVSGAQAGQAKEPSKKDQMLAKMLPQAQQPQAPAGLETLPAPNMAQMGQGMAEGGIIAFSGENGSVVNNPQSPSERAMHEYIRRIQTGELFNRQAAPQEPAPIIDPSTAVNPESSAFRQDAQRTLANRQLEIERQKLIAKFGLKASPVGYFTSSPQERREAQATVEFLRTATPQQLTDFARTNEVPTGGQEPPAGTQPPGAQPPGAQPPGAQPPGAQPPAGTQPPGVAPRAPGVGAPSPAVQQPQMPEGRKSPIDELMAPTEDIAKQVASSKNQAQGEFLMQMGAALLSTPNAGVALSKGIAAGLPGLAANRKEINAIQKDQRDYRLNLSKAQEAAAQGKDDLAFKYADLAEKAQYHAGVLAVSAQRAAGGGGNLSARQLQTATANANKALENELKRLGPRARLFTPEQRQTFMENELQRQLSMLQSGTVPAAPSIPTYGALPSGEAPLTR